jgi:hypothetical protein
VSNSIDEILIQKIKWILSGKNGWHDPYLATAEIKRLIDIHDQLKKVEKLRQSSTYGKTND